MKKPRPASAQPQLPLAAPRIAWWDSAAVLKTKVAALTLAAAQQRAKQEGISLKALLMRALYSEGVPIHPRDLENHRSKAWKEKQQLTR